MGTRDRRVLTLLHVRPTMGETGIEMAARRTQRTRRSTSASSRRARAPRPGRRGARTCRSGNGGRCARTTASDGDAWNYLPTTTPAPGPTGGARTASPGSATTGSACASRWRSGTARDPILKERMFGLTDAEGNHGEDVKETGSTSTPRRPIVLKCALQVPAARVPLRATSSRRTRARARREEYELLDTGVFDDERYFESRGARQGVPGRHLMPSPRQPRTRRRAADLLPTLWFRNTWSWGDASREADLRAHGQTVRRRPAHRRHPDAGESLLREPERLRRARCSARTRPTTSGSTARRTPRRYPKDGFTTTSSQARDAVNPAADGPRRRPSTPRTCRPAASCGASALTAVTAAGGAGEPAPSADFEPRTTPAAPRPTPSMRR